MKNLELIKNKGFGVLILVMILYVGIVFYSDINKISEIFIQIKYEFVVIIIVLQMISFCLRSYRQKKFLESSDIHLSFWENFKICLAGMSMVVTPGGAGMLIKSHFLKKKFGFDITKTAPAILAERYHDFLAVTTILLISLVAIFSIEVAISGIIALLLLIAVFGIIQNENWLKKLLEKIIKINFLKNMFPSDLDIVTSVKSLKTFKIMSFGWTISVILWMFDSLAIFYGFVALNLDIGFIDSVQIFFTSLIYGIISFLPAGIGVTEGIFIRLLLDRNVELPLATALILFIRFTTVWFLTFLGFVAIKFLINYKKS